MKNSVWILLVGILVLSGCGHLPKRPSSSSLAESSSEGAREPEAIAGSFVVAIQGSAPGEGDWSGTFLGSIGEDGKDLSLFEVKSSKSLLELQDQAKEDPRIRWVAPNYAYERDPILLHSTEENEIEGVSPFLLGSGRGDPLLAEQEHHRVTHAVEAWNLEAGKPGIVVAVTDDGVDIDHEDLKANIWTNPREIPDNGLDDDGNGYVDDLHGWNMVSGNNNPRPDAVSAHGTHVAGVIAEMRDNGVGGVGVAPGVRVMPIKWVGDGQGWTSAIVARSYLYAVKNGARIVTTSYNTDRWPGDRVVEEALAEMDKRGVLLFVSAGNFNEKDPPRTKLEMAIVVAGLQAEAGKEDVKSDASTSSNYGRGVDISAPGAGDLGILSTVPGQKYGRMSGTSVASPGAAAVAALVWSSHPSWSREQVYAQIAGTADKVDAKNPSYVNQLGFGRVNAKRALTEKIAPPQLMAFGEGRTLVVRLRSVFDLFSINQPEAWRIDRMIENGNAVTVRKGLSFPVKIATNEIRFQFQGLMAGTYRLVGSAAILRDPFGQALDGNGDGRGGDDFVYEFMVF